MKALLVMTIAVGSQLVLAQETPAQRNARFALVSKKLGSKYWDCWRVAGKIRRGPASDETAYILAHAYFYAFVNGCGYTGKPKDSGRVWEFQCQEGLGGKDGHKIFVDKKTGATWADGKVVDWERVRKEIVYKTPPRIINPRIYLLYARRGG